MFENLLGNDKIKKLLEKTINEDKILHSYIFDGEEGIGKRLFALDFSKAILCTSTDIKPCQICKSCIEFNNFNNPDLLQVESLDGKNIKIEQIRELLTKIAEKPINSDRKVIIINNSELMTKEAQNALLKTLEEPPQYITIILITSNQSKLLTTIKSRCTKILFDGLSKEEILSYLKQKGLDLNISDRILKAGNGSLSKTLDLIEKQDLYLKLDNIFNNIEKCDIVDLWKQAEILYKEKEEIIGLLEYINIILYENLLKDNNIKYINSVRIVEETKKRIMANSNYDMSIDNLLLRIWEEFN